MNLYYATKRMLSLSSADLIEVGIIKVQDNRIPIFSRVNEAMMRKCT